MRRTIDSINGKSHSEINLAQLRRLHYWLSYNRYTIFMYGGGFFIPWELLSPLLFVLPILFAPYVLFVLYRNGKRGWLITFAVMVVIPILFAFLSTGNIVLDTGLHLLPLLTFYLYCYLLRFSVGEWISDLSSIDQLWIDERNRQDGINQ